MQPDRSTPAAPRPRAMPNLAVYAYSQTGQLHEALTALLAPLEKAGSRIEWVAVRPKVAYPFPWPLRRFFGVFPEAVDPEAVVDIELDPPRQPRADLVVLGFQVWYLAPSIPVRSLLASRSFDADSVLGVVACRNMWYSAALDVRRRIEQRAGRYLGTVAAIDAAPAAVTFVTTLAWLLRGRRAPIWRLPPAGISASEITRLGELGEALAARFTADAANADTAGTDTVAGAPLDERVRQVLAAHDAAPVDVPIAAGDLIAGRAFAVWGRIIRASTRRAWRVSLTLAFVASLLGAIVLGLPLLVLVSLLGRSRLDAAVRARLAPVLAPTAAGSR